MDRKAHDVEVGTVHSRASDVAYPLLDTVGTGLVERAVFGDVVGYFFVREVAKSDICTIDERF